MGKCEICGKETELELGPICFECARELGIRASKAMAENQNQNLGKLSTLLMSEMRRELLESVELKKYK